MKKKKDDKTEKEIKPAEIVRAVIIQLDNHSGSLATSPMFQNLRTVVTAVSQRAKLDLEQIIELSQLLGAEVQKSAPSGN